MSKHILIVDDSDTCRKVTRLFLESQLDLDVCGEAVDGVDAIEKARALSPDLVVIDPAMPGMNGVEATSELRAMMPQVPIVLFHDVRRCRGPGLGIIRRGEPRGSKPDGGWKLIECVQSLLD